MQYSKKGNIQIITMVSTLIILAILTIGLVSKNSSGGIELGASKTAPSYVSDSYSKTSMWDTGYFWGDLEVKDDLWVDSDVTIGGNFILTGSANVGGLTYGLTTLASSTAVSSTLPITYLTNYSGLDYTPGNVAVTLTLPATSTMTSFISNAGECFNWRFRNLDGTAATSTTFAAGTGITLRKPETTGADYVIEGGNGALLMFCRELDSNVTVFINEYIN